MATRRDFLRGLLASAAVLPALPAAIEAATVAQPGVSFEVYTSYFRWDAGAVPKDWHYITRLVNLDAHDTYGLGPITDALSEIKQLEEAEGGVHVAQLSRLPSLSLADPRPRPQDRS
jgi:hypothetical protein